MTCIEQAERLHWEEQQGVEGSMEEAEEVFAVTNGAPKGVRVGE
jgi:hypothetical protein